MDFSTILLFIIACVITIYFTWNIVNYYNRPKNTKHEADIRYYELKSKYEFLVAVVSLVTAIAVFYGLGTKKDIEQNIKSGINSQLEPTKKRIIATEAKVDGIDKILKNAQDAINTYYDALKILQVKQKNIQEKDKRIEANSQITQNKFKQFNDKIDTLNKKNILKKNFYLIDNLIAYEKELYANGEQTKTFKFDTLLTSMGDHLPKFIKPPVIIPVSDMSYPLNAFDITNEGFKIFVDPVHFSMPKNGKVGIRLVITEVE